MSTGPVPTVRPDDAAMYSMNPVNEGTRRWLASHTQFLGIDGDWNYWGNPWDGHVVTVPSDPTCTASSFGDRAYWRGMRYCWRSPGTGGMQYTDIGLDW